MSVTIEQLAREQLPEVSVSVRNAGLAGAGGAGFPTYAKWERLGEVDALLMNHQESEPNYYIDKWLAREYAHEFAGFFDALLAEALDLVVVGAKLKDREAWMREFEAAIDADVVLPEDLPLDTDGVSGVVVAYTDDRYQYGMESVLLQRVADVTIGRDLPMDHGWLVQNTETLHRLARLVVADEPMVDKLVHVDGDVPNHRFLEVPVGTPASVLLNAAGRSSDALDEDEVLLDGGPGWCFEAEMQPELFGVRKRTNAVMVADRETVEANTLGDGRVDVRDDLDWDGDHETAPSRIDPSFVRIPLISNPDFEGVVSRSEPIVAPGERVSKGEMIARPAGEGISTAQHASVDGEVVEVTDRFVEIRRDGPAEVGDERGIYWTWCTECGTYAPMPDPEQITGETAFVCQDCRAG